MTADTTLRLFLCPWLLRGALAAALMLAAGPVLAQSCNGERLRVGVDIGHSPTVPGALSARGKTEYEFNRRFASELTERARAWPALQVIILNAGGKPVSLDARPALAAQWDADVFLSIHHDSVNRKYKRTWQHDGRAREYSDAFEGYSLFVAEQGANARPSLALARLMGRNLRAIGLSPTHHHAEPIAGENCRLIDPDLGVYAAPFAVLRHARLPAVLVEVGIIINRGEELKLEDPQHRSRIQASLLLALLDYCKGKDR